MRNKRIRWATLVSEIPTSAGRNSRVDFEGSYRPRCGTLLYPEDVAAHRERNILTGACFEDQQR